MKILNQFKPYIKLSFTLFLVFSFLLSYAQENEVEKKKARMTLNYSNTNNTQPKLTATVKTKVDKAYENVTGIPVNFYINEMAEDSLLGQVITNKHGEAILMLPETIKDRLTFQDTFYYIAAVEENPEYLDADADTEILRSRVELELFEEDSLKIARFFVVGVDSSGQISPMADVAARIYVKRMVGLLPVSEEFGTTDEEGYLSIEFPEDIPGDPEGNIEVVAQVRDHETLGTLTRSMKINWGVVLAESPNEIQRELWSARANAPIFLIIAVNALLLGIWGVMLYIILKLFEIRKSGSLNEESGTL